MKAIRAVRGAVLTLLAGVVILVIMTLWRSAAPLQRSVPDPVPEPPEGALADGPVEAATEGFHFTEERGGVIVTRLSAEKMLDSQGGSRFLADILIEARPEPETHPERIARIRAKTGRFDAVAHEVDLAGDVEVRLAHGESLTTSEIRYRIDERTARAEGPVSFTLPFGSGQGVGLRVSLRESRVELDSEVRVDSMEGSGGGFRLKAERLVHDGLTDRLVLSGAISLSGDWGTFSGRDLMVESREGEGSEIVSSAPGSLALSGSSLSGTRLHGDGWRFEVDQHQTLRSVTARPRARLSAGPDQALDQVQADAIECRLGTADVAEGLTARGLDGTPVESRLRDGPILRVESSSLRLSGRLPARQAQFEGNVRASGDGRLLQAATLTIHEDRSALIEGAAHDRVRMTEGVHALQAEMVRIRPDGGGSAEGQVEADLEVPGSEPSPGEQGKTRMLVSSGLLTFTPGGEIIRFSGDVRAWQGRDSLEAEWVLLDASRREIRAGGGLRLSFEEPSRAAAASRVQVEAGDLVWNRIDERAECAGNVSLRRAGAQMSTDRLTVDGIGGEMLRRILAQGRVSFWSAAWEGEGDRLEYSSADGVYRLMGESRDAEARNLASGGRLRGRALEIDAEGRAGAALAGPGGRVTVRTATTVPEQR